MVAFDSAVIHLSPDGSRRLAVSMRLNLGDIALLIGPNGCGKTTILDTIVGARRLQAGHMALASPNEPIAYAVQDPNSGLLPWRTILANIALPSMLNDPHEPTIRQRAIRLLDRFRLGQRKDDYPYRLSGGEKQTINFIRTLCTPCHLALFDEVLAPLHNDLRVLAKEDLTDWLKGKTAILVTHDPDDLDLPFNRYLTVKTGTLIEVDRTEAGRILRNDV